MNFGIEEGRISGYCGFTVKVMGFQLCRGRFFGLGADFGFEHSHFANPESEFFHVIEGYEINTAKEPAAP